MNINDKIYVAGHNGLVGSALVRLLQKNGYKNIITIDSANLDLRDQLAVRKFFQEKNPQYVFLAAAKVGGIMANKMFGAEFIYDNLTVQNNVIHEAYRSKVEAITTE